MTSCERTAMKAHQMACRSTSWRRGVLGFLQMAVVAAAAVLSGAVQASAGGRLALVLAAEEYQLLPRSAIGAKRGSDIADSLKALGFDVIVGTNPTNATARASVAEFSRKAQEADLALVVLAGHTTSANGQSFFLPVNVEIGAPTDLLSRGISITNLAHLVGAAKTGAVLVLMSVPIFPRPVEGIDPRPNFTADTGKSTVIAFSSSTKVPVSRVDALAGQNAEALAKVFQKPGATLSDAVSAVTADGGMVIGSIPDLRLDRVPPPPPPPVVQANASAGDAAQRAAALAAEQKAAALAAEQRAATLAAEQKAAALAAEQKAAALAAEQKAAAAVTERRLREEQSARLNAEARAAEERKRSSGIENELALAQEQARAARLEAERAKADAEKMLAEAERAKAQAEADKARMLIQAERDRAKLALEQAEAERKLASLQRPNVPSAPLDERELGQKQRLSIQERLKALSLYTGPVDAVMGPLTREAIMGFQKGRGEAVTGYLTPEQFKALVPGQ